jgi:AcrR family transcriptional regulator
VAVQRRSQAERTARTRTALLDATVECLVERGYHGTTTTEVAHRAGVSLGALVHHFPAKADLLTAAVAHVMDRRQGEFRKAMANVEPGADTLDAAIDQLWAAVWGPAFEAWVELWVAARTDPQLADAMLTIEDEFARASEETFRELFPPSAYSDDEFLRVGLRFAMSLVDGIALRSLGIKPPDVDLLDVLKVIARQFIERSTTTKESA